MAEFIYLNDPILAKVTVAETNTPCTYKVYIKDIGMSDWTMIYVGSLYYIKPCYITLNDIVQSHVNDFYWFDYNHYIDRPTKSLSNMYFDIKVEVQSQYDGTVQTEVIYNIFNGYRTPNLGDIKAFDHTQNTPLYPSYRYGYNVRPRIPSLSKYSSSDFRFPCYVFVNNSVSVLQLGVYNEGLPDSTIGTIRTDGQPLQDTTLTYSLISKALGSNKSLGVSNGEKYILLCDVDETPAEYYLQWVNRHGASQCQPFHKKNVLKETVKTNYISRLNNNTNLTYNHRMQLNPQVPYSKTVDYTWTLNSDWLTYDEYNEFESLLTSKYVYLYDYKHNTVHEVNVTTSNWEYKNNKNAKKPFNLTIDVKKASTDNIIY